jgi:hypothetical protein
MEAGLTAVSQATHSARPRLLANLPNALAIAPPTIKILGTLVPGNPRDRTFDGHALSSDLNIAGRMTEQRLPARQGGILFVAAVRRVQRAGAAGGGR